MKKTFFIQPRRSGKTTNAIYEFLNDPDNTLFVTLNFNMRNNFRHISNNVISSNQFKDKIHGRKFKTIILDEYLLFKNKIEIYEEIQKIQPDNVYIFSTPDELYDENIINFIKTHKQIFSFNSILKLSNENEFSYEHDKIYNLYYNFLTDPDTILVDTIKQNSYTEINRIELISQYGRELVLSQGTIKDVEIQLQDDGKTLKIFYTKRN
jgi:hypothetical protein